MRDEDYTIKGQMKQRRRQHTEAVRAEALLIATKLLTTNSGMAADILNEVAPDGTTGTRRLELLTNHLLTFIETGNFLEHGN